MDKTATSSASHDALVAATAHAGDPAAQLLLKEEFALLANELYRAMLGLISPVCRSFGITRQQMLVLVILRSNPNAKMGEVSDALGILRPNFTALANKMAEAGLVERIQGESDRRLWRLSLTPLGEEAVLALERSFEAKDGAIANAVDPQLYDDAVRGVRALRAIVREVEAGDGR